MPTPLPPLFESSSLPSDTPAPPFAASPLIAAAPPPSPAAKATPMAFDSRCCCPSSASSPSHRLPPSLAACLHSDLPSDEDSLWPFEEAKDRIKFARALISESKESFDTQLKIQKLRDTIFAV